MRKEEGKLLLSSLLGRLVPQDNGAMELPGGKFSRLEIEALRLFSREEVSEPESPAGDQTKARLAAISSPNEDRLTLVRTAFERTGPHQDHIRLCLDFGTAMSKAWATGADETETLPLALGANSAGEPTLPVESAVFIDDGGRVYVGDAAGRHFRSHAGNGRRLYDNIKRLLSDAEVESDLYGWKLEREIDPTVSGLSRGDLLVLYLAWLTDRSLEALAQLVATAGLTLPAGSDLRAVPRRYAIPCFEDTHNDGRGRSRAAWARRVMRQALLHGQVLADTLAGRWEHLSVRQLVPLMEELRSLDVTPLEHLLAEGADVREPVAAGASRFSSELLPRTGAGLTRHALLVIDSGAGTTDFAMFQVATGAGRPPRYALVRSSVKMSTVAGNTADSVLKPLILEACQIDPKTGAPRSPDDFIFIRNDLDARIREFKQILVSRGSIDIALSLNATGRLLLRDFTEAMRQHATELRLVRDAIVRGAFTMEVRTGIAPFGQDAKPQDVRVLLTGGSAALPAVEALAHGELSIDGFRVEFSPITEMPDWVTNLPPDAASAVAAAYSQCAVAIGGSAAELPHEIEDLREMVVPPAPGPRVLVPTRMSGPLD